MALSVAEVNAVDLARKVTIVVKIKNYRQFRIRNWVAVKLVWLAALVGGFGFEISELEEGKNDR